MPARNSNDFFAILPWRSHLIFLCGVFFVFSPLGLLLGSSFAQRRPWGTTLLAFLISGLLAVCWAATFTRSRWFVVGIVALTLAQIAVFGPARRSALGMGEVGFSPDAFLMVVGIALGYVLFVIFISGQGRTTLRLQTEIDLARQIHATLVPPLEVDLGAVEAVGASHASTEVGGDLIDVVRHAEGTDFILADVSGHGVKAGVVMSMVKAATRAHLMAPLSLGELMSRLNEVLEGTTTAEMYSTFVGLRVRGALLQYALAGHEHVLHFEAARGRVRRLTQRQLPLGLLAGHAYEAAEASVAAGDVLAVYTDGLNETENAAGEQLGHEPIEALLERQAGGSLTVAREAIVELARAHGPQVDDRTLLLIRVNSTD